MAGKVKVDKKSTKVNKYSVAGITLQEIWDDIKAKGPTTKAGKKVAGYTEAPVTLPGNFPLDGKIKKKKDEFEVEVFFKSVTMTMVPQMKVPQLSSDKDLSPAAKKEWKRFMKALMSHENEHVTVTENEAKKFGGEMLKLKGKAKGADKEKAKEEAAQALNKEQGKKHTDAKLQERLTKVNKGLDSGGHGPVLKTSIP